MNYYNHQRPFSGGGGVPYKKQRMNMGRAPHLTQNQHIQHVEYDPNRLTTFKEFVGRLPDGIDETEALEKYVAYKTDFVKKQIDKFFKAHHEEEWFINKYRPIQMKKIEEARKESKIKRKDAYEKLIGSNLIAKDILLDEKHRADVSKFLDYMNILLEGATIEELESAEDEEAVRSKYEVFALYIPNLHPSIDKSKIEESASQHPDFLRVAMGEAEARYEYGRKCWISYKKMELDSLRELSNKMNREMFNGHPIKSLINKNQSANRIHFTLNWFNHVDIVKADLKNIARLLTHYEGEECPMLDSIKDYLIEEKDEESKILGVDGKEQDKFEFKYDEELCRALDRVVLYLRVVHSFDYHACTEYLGEDDMPLRIGIMFIRPNFEPDSISREDSTHDTLRQFIEAHRNRLFTTILNRPTISEAEQNKLGRKNADVEVEEFIYEHTIEKKPGEKYVCKLTKKRFTATEFVRKHIFNRCSDKLDEVRTNAEFFNNYVADPNRPM